MKLHTDVLTAADVEAAARKAGCTIPAGVVEAGSRSRKRRLDFWLSGSGKHGGQFGAVNAPTALWDEWGIAIAELYRRDPDARFYPYYENAAHFHWSTGNRFECLTVAFVHKRHKWESDRQRHPGHYEHICDCGATRRYLKSNVSWAEFAAIEAALA